jgi:CheY-like chemotaxis protein
MSQTKFYVPPAEKTFVLGDGHMPVLRKKLLLLDDDEGFAVLTSLILKENGYEVEVAADGAQGIKKVLASDFSVILCDMMMPNLSGDLFYAAVERVKPKLCRRFLFMSGHQGDRKIYDFVKKVRGLILWKPFQSNVLIESIKAIEKKTHGE